MAQERPVTPEKQLLNLIEEQKAPASGVSIQTIRHRGLSLLSFSAWGGRLSFFRDRAKKWARKDSWSRQLDIIKLANNLLASVIFVCAVYFISSLVFSALDLKKISGLEPALPSQIKQAALLQDAPFLAKPLSYYLDKVRSRDIFSMVARKKEESSAAAPKGPSSRIMEATQSLKLVGISWSNDPDAMIEDTRSLRTFFVKRGQMIGEIKVQAIFKDKVILGYDGEEIELR